VFNAQEQTKISEGDLSYEIIGRINIPPGATDQERKQRLRRKYRSLKETFIKLNVDPKSFDVEYIAVPV
jgi:hypothetical protein